MIEIESAFQAHTVPSVVVQRHRVFYISRVNG